MNLYVNSCHTTMQRSINACFEYIARGHLWLTGSSLDAINKFSTLVDAGSFLLYFNGQISKPLNSQIHQITSWSHIILCICVPRTFYISPLESVYMKTFSNKFLFTGSVSFYHLDHTCTWISCFKSELSLSYSDQWAIKKEILVILPHKQNRKNPS